MLRLGIILSIVLQSMFSFADCDLFQSELSILRKQGNDLAKTMEEINGLTPNAAKEKSETNNAKIMRLLEKAELNPFACIVEEIEQFFFI